MIAVARFADRILHHRIMIRAMVVRQLQSRYAGTWGGTIWAVIHPVALVATYWFVFSIGFKVRSVGSSPFLLFFVCGLTPWMLFSEAVNGSAVSVVGNPHLVKRVAFPTELLPVVSLVSALVTHLLLLGLVVVLLAFYGIALTWNVFQLFYYVAATSLFALGVGWLVAAFNVFFRDLGQIVTVLLGIWFWLTPIVWPAEMLPSQAQPWLMANPAVYLVAGFRDALLGGQAIWDRLGEAAYFWVVCGIVLVVGAQVFRRLKPEFAEVL